VTDSTKLRRRRLPDPDTVPDDLVRWFETGGTGSPPWSALLAPDCFRLREHWLHWSKTHNVPPSPLLLLLMGIEPWPIGVNAPTDD
jgi:hypothetical protein